MQMPRFPLGRVGTVVSACFVGSGENAELKILTGSASWSWHDLALLRLMAAITCSLIANQKPLILYTHWVHRTDWEVSDSQNSVVSALLLFVFLIVGMLATGLAPQYSCCLGKPVLFSPGF